MEWESGDGRLRVSATAVHRGLAGWLLAIVTVDFSALDSSTRWHLRLEFDGDAYVSRGGESNPEAVERTAAALVQEYDTTADAAEWWGSRRHRYRRVRGGTLR